MIILFAQTFLLLLNVYVINSIGLHNQILVNAVIVILILFFCKAFKIDFKLDLSDTDIKAVFIFFIKFSLFPT